jgi:hypothetical protein
VFIAVGRNFRDEMSVMDAAIFQDNYVGSVRFDEFFVCVGSNNELA